MQRANLHNQLTCTWMQDNLDHIRPATGAWDAPSAWNLPGREFPGPAAE